MITTRKRKNDTNHTAVDEVSATLLVWTELKAHHCGRQFHLYVEHISFLFHLVDPDESFLLSFPPCDTEPFAIIAVCDLCDIFYRLFKNGLVHTMPRPHTDFFVAPNGERGAIRRPCRGVDPIIAVMPPLQFASFSVPHLKEKGWKGERGKGKQKK